MVIVCIIRSTVISLRKERVGSVLIRNAEIGVLEHVFKKLLPCSAEGIRAVAA